MLKERYPSLIVGAVGQIETPTQANDILKSGDADVVLLARAMIRDPHFVLTAARDLGVAVKPANQYERGWMGVLGQGASSDWWKRDPE